MYFPARRAAPHLVRLGQITAIVVLALFAAATSPRLTAAPLPPDQKPAASGKQSALGSVAEDVSAAEGEQISIAGAGGRLVQCSSYGGPNWTSRNSRNYQTIRSCSLTAPVDGVAYINATATGVLPRDEAGWIASFQLASGATPNSLQGDDRTERTLYLLNNIDLPDNSDSQSTKTLATSLQLPLAAGTHAFGLIGLPNFGEARLSNPAISVLFVPGTAGDVATCGQGTNTWSATPTANFQSIVSCSLNLPQDGYAFVSATSAVTAQNQQYEARFRVGSDLVGTAQSDRYVNVYPNALFAVSETVASSMLIPVRAGANTFHFLGYRYAGSGTMSVRDPYLSVIYFPSTSLSVIACGAAGANLVSIEQATFTPVVSCRWIFRAIVWRLSHRRPQHRSAPRRAVRRRNTKGARVSASTARKVWRKPNGAFPPRPTRATAAIARSRTRLWFPLREARTRFR